MFAYFQENTPMDLSMFIVSLLYDDLFPTETNQTSILHFILTFSCYLYFLIEIFSLNIHHRNHNLNFVFQCHTLLYFHLIFDFVFENLHYYFILVYMIIIDSLLIKLALLR